MRLHSASRDRAAAIRVYEHCVDVLRRELDAAPGSELRDLFTRLTRPAAAASAAAGRRDEVSATPLVGRTHEILVRTRWFYRVFGTMFVTFALIALTLSAMGLYAMTAYSVRKRMQEIGIGLTLGMAGAFGVGRLLRSILAQTSATDPFTFLMIATVFMIVSVAACLLAGAARNRRRSD
jgi:Bacterial transcriptional activator domain